MRHLLNRAGIRGRIVTAFALVLCCTVGLGVFAVHRLAAVNASAADMRETWLPSARALGRVAQLTERVRPYQGLFFLAESNEERQARNVKTAKAVADLHAALREYEPLIIPGEEQRLAEALMQAWSAYGALSAQLAELTARDDARERALVRLHEPGGASAVLTAQLDGVGRRHAALCWDGAAK